MTSLTFFNFDLSKYSRSDTRELDRYRMSAIVDILDKIPLDSLDTKELEIIYDGNHGNLNLLFLTYGVAIKEIDCFTPFREYSIDELSKEYLFVANFKIANDYLHKKCSVDNYLDTLKMVNIDYLKSLRKPQFYSESIIENYDACYTDIRYIYNPNDLVEIIIPNPSDYLLEKPFKEDSDRYFKYLEEFPVIKKSSSYEVIR